MNRGKVKSSKNSLGGIVTSTLQVDKTRFQAKTSNGQPFTEGIPGVAVLISEPVKQKNILGL